MSSIDSLIHSCHSFTEWRRFELLPALGDHKQSCSLSLFRLPRTGWLINNRKLFLIGLESGSPRSIQDQGAGTIRFGWGSSFQLQITKFSLYPHMTEREGELSRVPFVRALTPFMRDPLTQVTHLSKVPHPNIITLGIRFQYQMFWMEEQTFRP